MEKRGHRDESHPPAFARSRIRYLLGAMARLLVGTEYHRKRAVFANPEMHKQQISHGLGEFVSQNCLLGLSVRSSLPGCPSAPQRALPELGKTDLFFDLALGRFGAPSLEAYRRLNV